MKHTREPAATVTAMTPDRVRAIQARRASNAAGAHDTRQRGTRTRAGSKAAAIRDSRG